METTQRALENLAEKPDIAEWLKAAGYKGERCNSVECPIAEYLEAVTGTMHVVSDDVIINLGDDRSSYVPPAPVAQFIRAFDSGSYSDLRVPTT